MSLRRLLFPKPSKLVRKRKPLNRGKRPGRQRKTSRAAMGRTADRLFSLIVRSGNRCVAWEAGVSLDGIWDHACKGPLQPAHLVSRRYRSTRWDEDNAIPLCAGAHTFFTFAPLEWDAFVEQYVMSPAEYAALKHRALAKWDGDLESVLVRLAARAVALGIQPEKR